MKNAHASDSSIFDRVHDFVVAGATGDLTAAHLADFEQLLRESDEACRLYFEYVENTGYLRTILDAMPDDTPLPPELFCQEPGDTASFTLSGTLLHSTPGIFLSGTPVAYLLATIIVGIGLAIMAVIPAAQPDQVGAYTKTPVEQLLTIAQKTEVVGRITGMVDCVWKGTEDRGQEPEDSRQGSEFRVQESVVLGQQVALRSGLLEITYDTGAKVLLQGPVTYEVGANGGYLAVGKLTGKLEKKAVSGRWPLAGIGERGEWRGKSGEGELQQNSPAQPQSALTPPLSQKERGPEANPQSRIPNPFAVRTPSAVVTDLGTEFGVEVTKDGNTTSYVYRGAVRLQTVSCDGKTDGEIRILRENESACIKSFDGRNNSNRITAAGPVTFVRKIPKQTMKFLDLVDVVAGGNGFSGRRNAGIDPITGRVVGALDTAAKTPWLGDGRYHHVSGRPFVDGVFVPDGKAGPVRLDSAGHTFDGFLKTSNASWQYIWAGGDLRSDHVPTVIEGVDYASSGHGTLYFNGNSAITFDLEAIRKANPGCKLLRFRSVATNACPFHHKPADGGGEVVADIRVFVDGRLWFERWRIARTSGVFTVVVPIGNKDRFLTLATTDGGDGVSGDWLLFGDPRLEMTCDGAPSGSPQSQETAEQ